MGVALVLFLCFESSTARLPHLWSGGCHSHRLNSHSCDRGSKLPTYGQGGVTPIDSIVTAVTAAQNFDRLSSWFDC